MRIARATAVMLVLIAISGCTFHKQWRENKNPCEIADSKEESSDCHDSLLQEFKGKGKYTVGYVEFNDQGELFSREQMNNVLDSLQKKAKNGDVLMMVFAHGWNHRAKEGDSNINTFRKALESASITEQNDAKNEDRTPREVFGIYIGWRGLSLKLPVLEYLTFWDRKNTAAKVGAGDVTELLSRIERIKRDRDDTNSQNKKAKSDTRLVVIGHSFGGLVVQSAIDRILIDRAIRSKEKDTSPLGIIEGFGNLVVLINPAFEAQRYNSLFNLQKDRQTYSDNQLPVELVLTSRKDYPTKLAFPVGRVISSTFEKKGWESKNLQTIGHYEDFVTHHLSMPEEKTRNDPEYFDCFTDPATIAQSWFSGDRKGNRHILGGLILQRNQLSERSPFLNISVSGDLIKGHNDVDEDQIIEFASRMISLSSITERKKKSAAKAAMNLKSRGFSSLRSCDLSEIQ